MLQVIKMITLLSLVVIGTIGLAMVSVKDAQTRYERILNK